MLLKQERAEATQAVDARLKFISSEIKRIEKQIKEMQEEGEAKKMEVILPWPWIQTQIGMEY